MKQGWEIKKLGDIAKFYRGLTYSKDDEVPSSTNMVLRSNNVDLETNALVYYDMKCLREDLLVDEDKKVKANSILICMSNGSKQHIGKVAYIQDDIDYAFGGFMGLIVPTKDIEGKYLYYLCVSHHFKHFLAGIGNGIGITNLRFSDLSSYCFPVPPIAEQEKIVAELDCLSGIIEKKKQQLKELDNLAQSIFYEMFSNQDGTPVKLSQACSVVSGLVNPNDEPYCNYPHIGGANIESHTGKFVNVKLAKEENLISGKYPFDDTMILYSKIRPNLNKVALPSFKGICSADMYPLIPQNEFDKVFLKYILKQKVFLDYAISHSGRANIPKINREDLLNYEFLTYPITLQQDFASKIESIEKQKELIAQSIKETETLFNSRMDYYFN